MNDSLRSALSREDVNGVKYELAAALRASKDGDLDALAAQLADFLIPDAAAEQQAKEEAGMSELSPEEEKERIVRSVEDAVNAIRAGEFVVVQDHGDRENEGDLIIAAEKATEERIAFMVNYTSGMICVGISGEWADELELPPMVSKNTDPHGTAYTVSCDYKIGTTTGISAADRAATIRSLADPTTKVDELSRPGHVFPLRAREGGVLTRGGHTESSVDLARLAGLFPAGAMCEIVNRNGSMTRPAQLRHFAARHNLKLVTVMDLIEYRKMTGK